MAAGTVVAAGRIVFAALFRFAVEGERHIPRRGGVIIAANHRSFLDPPVLGIACSRRLRYMARESLFSSPLFAAMIRLLGAVPIPEGGSPVASLRQGLRLLRSGQPVAIFPEGTRVRGPEIGRGRPGIGFLAVRSGCPVVPALIVGSDRALPRSAFMVRAARVRVRFGPPVVCTGDYEEASETVMRNIRALEER